MIFTIPFINDVIESTVFFTVFIDSLLVGGGAYNLYSGLTVAVVQFVSM
jgi:hypothetical protein